eukprot:TRINITY_DN11669_c0_g1_i1.p1 TRINITY_DN11669_c0_g1~~TRINITY_DN11669_c0_g1_i1.p1  ORF type:complete len:188 (-),score=24.01 TRINITY_DN11669_c0_g1_i1:128-691(-)
MEEYKITITGPKGVGKTSFAAKYVLNEFGVEYDPTFEDSYRKMVSVDDKPVLFDIYDTTDFEQPTLMHEQFMRESQGFILVYSINSRSSFDELATFRDHICRTRDLSKISICLIGNKCDLEVEREVTRAEGQDCASNFGVPFFETSAKTGANGEEVFFSLVRAIRRAAKGDNSTDGLSGRGSKCCIS